MEFKLDGLLVAIFGILPGFVSTGVRQTLAPAEISSAGEWVARSTVASMVFNLFAATIFVLWFLPDFFYGQIKNVETVVEELPGWNVLVYLSILYGLAILWGVITGLGAELAPRELAYRFRLTPIAPTPNVFNAALAGLVRTKENLRLRGRNEQRVPWLRVARADSVIIGRLRRDTVKFDLDKPIEAFLSPAFVLRGGVVSAGETVANDGRQREGLYLRLRPEDAVEIFTARADWVLTADQLNRRP